MENIINRINQMEEYFDMLQGVWHDTPERIWESEELQKALEILKDYYENGQWLRDFECDERGELPVGLKRGVLSEDGLYHLLDDIFV